MYQKGELKVVVPPCAEALADQDGFCFSDEHAHDVYDSNGLKSNPVGTVFLPHSCDSWVIGGKKEIQDLVDDLLAALSKT